MLKQIELAKDSKVGSLVNSEPFLLLGNEQLEIELICNNQSVLVVSIKNGKDTRQMLVYDKHFIIPQEMLKEGELNIIVSLYNARGLDSKWICEPIVLIKVEEDVFEAHPKIDKLEQELSELRAEVHALEETVSELQGNVCRLWELAES